MLLQNFKVEWNIRYTLHHIECVLYKAMKMIKGYIHMTKGEKRTVRKYKNSMKEGDS